MSRNRWVYALTGLTVLVLAGFALSPVFAIPGTAPISPNAYDTSYDQVERARAHSLPLPSTDSSYDEAEHARAALGSDMSYDQVERARAVRADVSSFGTDAASCLPSNSLNSEAERELWSEIGVAGSAQLLTDLRHGTLHAEERQQFFDLGVVGGAQALTNARHAQCGES